VALRLMVPGCISGDLELSSLITVIMSFLLMHKIGRLKKKSSGFTLVIKIRCPSS